MIFSSARLAESAPIIIFKGFRGWEASVTPFFRRIGQSPRKDWRAAGAGALKPWDW